VPDVAFAIPGDAATLTGGYLYARRLMDALPQTGWSPRLVSLPDGFPTPGATALRETAAILHTLEKGAAVVVDGLAFGAIPAEALGACAATLIALVHHPLAAETGLSATLAATLETSERTALALAAHVITTSGHTADRLMQDYGVARSRITVARPGTDAAPRARGGEPVPRVLTVATVTPRKGHDLLIRALADLADVAWHLDCVGSLDRDQDWVGKIQADIAHYGLQRRVTLHGGKSPADLEGLYAAADVFALPSRYEGYGMAFAEALARGLPVVACAAGAVPETVPAGAGYLVPVDDPNALSAALRRLLTDQQARREVANGAWIAGQALPRWHDTARTVADLLTAATGTSSGK
jgi:glycosyltransferase involved in cell wall biosynthesis